MLDTKGSLTLQALTALGIHNLPAMNPVWPFKKGVHSARTERAWRASPGGGLGIRSATQSGREFQHNTKHFNRVCLDPILLF